MDALATFIGGLAANLLHQVTLVVALVVGIALARKWWAFAVGGVLTTFGIEFIFARRVAAEFGWPNSDAFDLFIMFSAGALLTVVVQAIARVFYRREAK